MTCPGCGAVERTGRDLGCAVAVGLAVIVSLAGSGQTQTPTPMVREHVEVRRVQLDAHVVDSKGQPIEGLTAESFRVYVDGVPARIESLEWVSGTKSYPEGLTPEEAAPLGATPAPQGRALVLFFQADYVSSIRLTGLMGMKSRAIAFLDTLQPADQVAVTSYDSHLKLRLDFTTDHEKIAAAIHQAILLGDAAPIAPQAEPSLAAHWDWDAAARAGIPEKGLYELARAMRPLPGHKTLVFYSWGLGTKTGDRVWLGSKYDAARRELLLGRISVNAIDITDADFHTLEAGLRQIAYDTGGFYAKTNTFPGQAMRQLEGAIAGHYLLVIEDPATTPGEHAVAVELVGIKKGRVLAPSSYQD
jgi:VWFA-related protein